jgi:ABC-type sugar transport system permease subunit
MNTILFLFMVAAFLVVVVGVIAMAVNGKFNKENSNKLMRMRLYFQAAALAVVVIAVWLAT